MKSTESRRLDLLWTRAGFCSKAGPGRSHRDHQSPGSVLPSGTTAAATALPQVELHKPLELLSALISVSGQCLLSLLSSFWLSQQQEPVGGGQEQGMLGQGGSPGVYRPDSVLRRGPGFGVPPWDPHPEVWRRDFGFQDVAILSFWRQKKADLDQRVELEEGSGGGTPAHILGR